MNASQMTFGVEIETVAPESAVSQHGLRIGGYRFGVQVPYLPAGWKAEQDGSIDVSGGGHRCEIISPVLKGAEGLAQVVEVINKLNEVGHRVNMSCGVHVHIGWQGDASALARLVTITSYLQDALYAITGTKHRENGRYCKGVKVYGNQKAAHDRMRTDRYHILNLTNLGNRKNTVEFRCFSGSLSVVKITGWIQVCLGLVERAMSSKKSPSWSPKPLKGGWAKDGKGQSEAERLMGYLAWGDGYAKLHGGKRYGLINPAAEDTIKAEFRRLARKYDEMQ